MWYNYFNKESWNLRVWRKANLKFNQDDFGMYRFKLVLRWKDFLFRLCRTEGTLRGSNFFVSLSLISILAYLKSTYYDEKFVKPKLAQSQKEIEAKDEEAKGKLFYNRFGAPSRPHRNLDDLLTFLAGSATLDQLADFVSYNTAMEINMDIQKGLDSWMSEEDKKMLHYYQQSLKSGGH